MKRSRGGIVMRAAARSTCSACAAAALMVELAGCTSDTSLALEAARGACAATLQALYDPISIDQPVTIPRVANTSTDAEKFEFIWKRDQISGLSWRLLPPELGQADDGSPRQSTTETQIRRYAIVPSGETSYACRGSLAVRSIHGVWLRRTGSPGQVTEIKLTRHPVSF
jgi:hypothetical protein